MTNGDLDGRPDRARSTAAAASDRGPDPVEAHRLGVIASTMAGDLDGAAGRLTALARAAGARGTEEDARVLRDCERFLQDQRRATAHIDRYSEFFLNGRRAGRWAPGRASNLEIFAREDRCEELFADSFELARTLQRVSFSPAAADALADSLRRRAERLFAAAHAESPPLLFLSDSHSRYFEWLIYDGLLPQTVAGVCSVSQANLFGLRAPSRDVPTLARFRAALDAFPPSTTVVLHIGEVDCRAIYWNLAQRTTVGRDYFLNAVTDNLNRLLDAIQDRAPRVVVTAPIHPSYRTRPADDAAPTSDSAPVSGAAVLDLTIALNRRMAAAAAARDLPFVSINETLQAFGLGLDAPFYRVIPTSAKMTHHLYPPKVAGFWSRALAPHVGGAS